MEWICVNKRRNIFNRHRKLVSYVRRRRIAFTISHHIVSVLNNIIVDAPVS